MTDAVNHPAHYGGADNPYEAIKVIEAWRLGFNLGNTIKYISRADHKKAPLQDLEKAAWYLQREIERMRTETGQVLPCGVQPPLHPSAIDPNTCHHSWIAAWGGEICQYCNTRKKP